MVTVSGKGSRRLSVAGLTCFKPDARSRLFYWVRVHRVHRPRSGRPGIQDREALCYRTQLWSARKPQTGLYW